MFSRTSRLTIEVKSSETVGSSETRGLRAFSEEHPSARLIIVSMEQRPRRHKVGLQESSSESCGQIKSLSSRALRG